MKEKKIRYAVVGQGHIAQAAVLPAFRQTKKSELVALVSGDPTKLRVLSRKYKVPLTYSYIQFDECLRNDNIDAVYIALPNFMHREYTILAASAGKHVLCEKPLSVTSVDSERMIRVAREKNVKLMTAYRLHFDPANLKAIQKANSGQIGDPQIFTSEFGHQVKADNVRMMPKEGGGPLHDLGIYCINAARNIFKSEPVEVFAIGVSPDRQFSRIYETVSATLKFPKEKIATFTCSFGSAPVSNFRVVGNRGDLNFENPYKYVGDMTQKLTINKKSRIFSYKAGDQFAAELDYFSNCILRDREPETSGVQGLADVQIIEALYESIRTGRSVSIRRSSLIPRELPRPTLRQVVTRQRHRKPKLVRAEKESR